MQNSNPDPKLDHNRPQTRFLKNSDFYGFYDFYIEKGSLGAHVDEENHKKTHAQERGGHETFQNRAQNRSKSKGGAWHFFARRGSF